MLRLRVITAVVLLGLLLPTLWVSSAWPFALFALLLASAGAWEWARLQGVAATPSLAYAAVCGGIGAVILAQGLPTLPGLSWLVPALAWVWACVRLMPRGVDGWRALPARSRLLAGIPVLIATWLSLCIARSLGINLLLSVLCIVWVSDVSAYFAGRRWGRRKLAPSLSPGKTWEGVAGACVGVLLLSVLWMALESRVDLGSASVFSRTLEAFGPVGLVGAVALLVALGIAGDLFESMIKRAAGVKDSSGLLPGHGGVLDRIDALLPVLPAAMAVLALGAR